MSILGLKGLKRPAQTFLGTLTFTKNQQRLNILALLLSTAALFFDNN